MTTFFIVLAASFIGQITALWIVGYIAHRKQLEQAKRIQQAIMEADKEIREKGGKMRDYIRMES